MAFSPLGQVMNVSRFTNDAAGLEKTLRLLQSLALIVSYNALEKTGWNQARKQLALGRRYLRFTKFIDCFTFATTAFREKRGVVSVLEVGKWSCLGMYLLLESCTIMDAMGIWSTEWAPRLFLEAMKFWFYSLSFSLLLGLAGLYNLWTEAAPSGVVVVAGDEKEDEEKRKLAEKGVRDWNARRQNVSRKMIVDACDMFIPATTVGWMELRPDILGAIMVTSTVLSSVDIWGRLNL
ncbi:AoPex11B [Phlyctema vagabunda]|uniref:AoPex11B n=1 Tax=Phlyctema vagabunda TaxID=108571 RepID=A0ABR4P287_9HELO